MMVKRIVSCLAMVVVAFLVSCYDVQLDKAETSQDWAKGLSDAEIITWMEVKTESVATKAGESDVEVSWECPIDSTDWEVAYTEVVDSNTGDPVFDTPLTTTTVDGTTSSKADAQTITIIKTPCYEIDATVYYKYSFKYSPTITDINLIGYFKIMMPDLNTTVNGTHPYYSTITSFVVYPDPATVRVAVKGAEASLTSDVYCNFASGSLFIGVNANNVPASPAEKTLSALRMATFNIITDYTPKGYNYKRIHVSNSSYCKVRKIANNRVLSDGKVSAATLEYSFEDLDCSMRRFEPNALFDYNDVVLTVDILQ